LKGAIAMHSFCSDIFFHVYFPFCTEADVEEDIAHLTSTLSAESDAMRAARQEINNNKIINIECSFGAYAYRPASILFIACLGGDQWPGIVNVLSSIDRVHSNIKNEKKLEAVIPFIIILDVDGQDHREFCEKLIEETRIRVGAAANGEYLYDRMLIAAHYKEKIHGSLFYFRVMQALIAWCVFPEHVSCDIADLFSFGGKYCLFAMPWKTKAESQCEDILYANIENMMLYPENLQDPFNSFILHSKNINQSILFINFAIRGDASIDFLNRIAHKLSPASNSEEDFKLFLRHTEITYCDSLYSPLANYFAILAGIPIV
jgi:hypothetical protein